MSTKKNINKQFLSKTNKASWPFYLLYAVALLKTSKEAFYYKNLLL